MTIHSRVMIAVVTSGNSPIHVTSYEIRFMGYNKGAIWGSAGRLRAAIVVASVVAREGAVGRAILGAPVCATRRALRVAHVLATTSAMRVANVMGPPPVVWRASDTW